MPGKEDRFHREQDDHAVRFGRAPVRPATHRDCREHQVGTIRLDDQYRPTWFYRDSLCLHFLPGQQWPKLCRVECEHTVLQPHHRIRDDGREIWLGDSGAGARSSVGPSEKYAFFLWNSSDPFLFVRGTAYNLFDNDRGPELPSRLGPRSRAGTIAVRKISAHPVASAGIWSSVAYREIDTPTIFHPDKCLSQNESTIHSHFGTALS